MRKKGDRMKQVAVLILSCTFLSVSAMEQAIQDGNWYTVCNLIQNASDDKYNDHVQALLTTNQDLNACPMIDNLESSLFGILFSRLRALLSPGDNDLMTGDLDSSLFGILLSRSCDSAYHTVRYESLLASLINAKKIDLTLPNNKKVVPALESAYKSVRGKDTSVYRNKLRAISNDTNFNLFTIGIAAMGLAMLVSIIWYASQDDESEDGSDDETEINTLRLKKDPQ